VTNSIAVIDFETTGLDAYSGDRPTEVAVVFVENGQVVDRYQRLINPGRPIPSFVTSLTGITDAMVRNAPSVGTVMSELHDKIGTIPLVAHNASFDRKFLDNELSRIGRRRRQDFICSMRVARRLLKNAPDYKLGTLVKHIGITVSTDAHRALADAEMTAKLWLEMERALRKRLNRRDIPLSLLAKLQSVTIARADDYIREFSGTDK
jgi:DNA polymerase-3 subunit epsilon